MCIPEKRLLPKTATNGQILVWSAAAHRWLPQDNVGGGGGGSAFDPSEDQDITGNYIFTNPVEFSEYVSAPTTPASGFKMYCPLNTSIGYVLHNGNRVSFEFNFLTANRSYIFPNQNGTIAMTSQLPTTTNLLKLSAPMDGVLRPVLDYAGSEIGLSVSIPLFKQFKPLAIESSFASSGGAENFQPLNITYSINNSGAQTGTATGIYLRATDTDILGNSTRNGMAHNLMDLGTAALGSSFWVTRTGAVYGNGFNSIGYFDSFQRVALNSGANYNPLSYITSRSVGTILLLDNSEGDFNRLQFGGTTGASPALKKSGNSLHAMLADDSDYTIMKMAGIYLKGINAINGANAGNVYFQTWNNFILNIHDTGLGLGQAAFVSNHASALLQMNSTSQGFLMPRMTTAQKDSIAGPATGLLVYDTDQSKLSYYQGAGFVSVYDCGSDIIPCSDNTFYIGKNSNVDPMAFKGVILKDISDGGYYRVEVREGAVQVTLLT